MDNLERVRKDIREFSDIIRNKGYYELYNTDPTTTHFENIDKNINIYVNLKEGNIGRYFYCKYLVKKGKWKKEYTNTETLLNSIDTDFENDVRGSKIDNLLGY